MFYLRKIFQSLIFLLIFLFLSILVCSLLILEIKKFENEISQIFLTKTSSIPYLKEHNKSINLIFVGDIMLDRGVEYMIKKYGNGDYKFPFLKITDYLNEADILFANLEGPISEKGTKVGSIYSFRANPKAVEGLTFAGFDILSVANNHILDYGFEALEDTFFKLKEAKIGYLGGGFSEKEAYASKILEIKGTKIAFLAYTNLGSEHWAAKGENSGIAFLEKERMKENIKNAKEKADLVIVSLHYGEEYWLKPTPLQISISQEAIDSGADLIIGHHSHVIQQIEKYPEGEPSVLYGVGKSGYIAYSLGNFVFDQGFSEETTKGLILKVLIKNRKIREVIPIEIKINQYFQPEISNELNLGQPIN